MVDSGQSVSERMDLVDLGAEANRAQHVRALDDQRDLRIRCVVPCVEAEEVLIVVLDIDAGESDDGTRICGCLGGGRKHDGQYTRIEHGGDGGGGNAADPNFGCRGIGSDRLQCGGSFSGERGRTCTGSAVRGEHNERGRRRRTVDLLSARDGVVRNKYRNKCTNNREPDSVQLREWLEAVLHLTLFSLEDETRVRDPDFHAQNSSTGDSALFWLDLSD